MHKYLQGLILLILLGAAVPVGSAWPSTPVRAKILQYKLNRLYLGAGSELLIRRGCPVRVICGGDTLARTEIAGVLEGVAVTQKVTFGDSIAPAGCVAEIIPARLDSGAVVRLGTDLDSLSPAVQTLQQAIHDSAADRVTLTVFEHRVDMLMAYDDGRLDGYLSYRSAHGDRKGQQVAAVPAPYVAVLIPNPAQPFNQYGELTTSLYYRFNSDDPSALFAGDSLRPVFSFIDASATRRAFPYDPYRGRQLFQRLGNRPERLTIGIADRAFERLSAYYADLLARDNCRLRATNNAKDADVTIAWLPLDTTDDEYHLPDRLVAMLSMDTLTGQPINEDIRLTARLLQNARGETDTLRASRLRQQAEQTLIDEIGVFPLFRPTLFVTQHDNVIGTLYNRTSGPHPERLFILRMPTVAEEKTK